MLLLIILKFVCWHNQVVAESNLSLKKSLSKIENSGQIFFETNTNNFLFSSLSMVI